MSLEDRPVKNEAEDITTPEGVMDLSLPSIKKTRIRINGENSKILELNISDMGIVSRLQTVYDQLQELAKSATNIPLVDTDEESLKEASATLMEIDAQMREKVDYLFDAPVSEVCANGGTMFDPVGGKFRFEYIIEKLSDLYKNNFKTEFAAMEKNIQKRTAKYITPQDHLTSTKKRSRKS